MKRWTTAQKRYVWNHINAKPLPQIARDIGKSEMALDLFIHRNRNDPRLCKTENNLLIRVLKKKFKDVACFTPTRSFFNDVRIGQKRYWSIYKGSEVIREDELKRVANYFEVSLEGIQEARQTELFEKQ